MKLKKVIKLLFMTVLLFAISGKSVLANGTKTQVFIANEIIEELENDGDSIEIEGLGKMSVEPSIREAILKQKDAFRAGAVGPDFYPSYLVGLRGIHANESGYYLQELIKNYIANPPADKNERQKIEAFLLGMQIHYAGDTISRREFNNLAGGDFPRIAANMNKNEANVVLRYTAIDGYYDSILPDKGYSYKISAPIDFVAKHMVFNGEHGGKINRGLNYKYYYSKDENKTKVGEEIPLVFFVEYHNQIINLRNTLSGNVATGALSSVTNVQGWINNIEGTIKEWISANERIASRVLDGEATAFALGSEYKNFVDNDFKMLLPAGKIIGYVKKYTPVGLLDELTGASDYITGEVTDLVVSKISVGDNVKNNSIIVDQLLDDSALFKEGPDSIKEKIRTAGDKSLKEAMNLSKLLLLKKSELAKIPDMVGVKGNGRWLKLETLKSNELKETITGVNLEIKTGNNVGDGTDSDVKCLINFTDGTEIEQLLDDKGKNDFEMRATHTYFVDFGKERSLSEIDRITIGISSHVDDWLLEKVTIKTASGRVLSSSYPNQLLNPTSRRRTVFPDIAPRYFKVRVKTKKNAGLFSRESSTNGTDGDVYVRVNYSDRYFNYKLDKSFYNDFESNDDDTYEVPVELSFGYNFSDIKDIVLYKENGDDWKPKEAWVYVNNVEQKHTWIDNWVNREGRKIGGAIYGYDVDIAGMPRYEDVIYGNSDIIPEFFSTVYSLDKKDGIDNNFILSETPEVKEKVYNCVVTGTYKPDENISINSTEELSYDFIEDVNIIPFDGSFARSSKYGGSITTDLGNKTHGLAVLDDSYFKNGTIEATIQLETSKDDFVEGNGGFNFRVSEPGYGPSNHKGYYVGIKASANGNPGEVMIGSHNSGKWRRIGTYRANISLKKDYKLKVVVKGIYIDVYLDGKKVMSVTDSEYKEGQIGFSMWKSHPIYKNIKVMNNKTKELSYDFSKDVNITAYDGRFLRSSSDGGSMVGLLGNLTHGKAVLDDSYFIDGTIESTVQILPADDGFLGNAGFNFRLSEIENGPDNHKGYYVGIKASDNGKLGQVMIGSHNKGQFRTIKTHDIDIKVGAKYKLKVVADGVHIDVYLDGKKIMSITDSDHKDGQIGFSMWRANVVYEDIYISGN